MSTRAQDARHVPLSKADRLRQDAGQAAQVRAYLTHPDVVALRVERLRTLIDAMAWIGIILGLGFTMVNVQQFAAAGAAPGSLAWCAAWLLDPMVSLVLIAVLLAEQVTARYQVPMRVGYAGPWVQVTKRFAFVATYAMNTWSSYAAGSLSGIVLHSVPPLLVFCAAEAAPILRDRLTEAVLRAARMATVNASAGVQDNPGGPSMNGTHGHTVNASTPVHDTAAIGSGERPPSRSRPTARKPAKARRKLLADYVTEARAHLTPGVVPSPAWVRQVLPGIARGTSQNVADALKADLGLRPVEESETSTDQQEGRAA